MPSPLTSYVVFVFVKEELSRNLVLRTKKTWLHGRHIGGVHEPAGIINYMAAPAAPIYYEQTVTFSQYL